MTMIQIPFWYYGFGKREYKDFFEWFRLNHTENKDNDKQWPLLVTGVSEVHTKCEISCSNLIFDWSMVQISMFSWPYFSLLSCPWLIIFTFRHLEWFTRIPENIEKTYLSELRRKCDILRTPIIYMSLLFLRFKLFDFGKWVFPCRIFLQKVLFSFFFCFLFLLTL